MKSFRFFLIFFLIVSSKLIFGQKINPFMDDYKFYQRVHSERSNNYEGIDGIPYLNPEFQKGVIRLKDSTLVKLMLRYDIYSDVMEFQYNDNTYSVENPLLLDTIFIGESVFVYLPTIEKGGYFEIYESGKCILAQKRVIEFKEAEDAKPIEGISKPARFVSEPDIFYLMLNNSNVIKVNNMKSVVNLLQDQKSQIENYIKQQNIKNTNRGNLIEIVRYYNSL